ncbi:hypothetical protein [Mycobacterium lepromatosis]|uniref:hypothetical protein n=1 Tax=Mycobacterium lepromatosis TaxID=480418 RepID=UPI0006787E12|nr:hypothetical protein [Mycobacterium lepromatosis]
MCDARRVKLAAYSVNLVCAGRQITALAVPICWSSILPSGVDHHRLGHDGLTSVPAIAGGGLAWWRPLLLCC